MFDVMEYEIEFFDFFATEHVQNEQVVRVLSLFISREDLAW